MTPIPQEIAVNREAETRSSPKGNDVVISGMSGLYPQSHSVKELSNILYNKINPITPNSSRWKYNHPEVAQSTGMIPDLEVFDAQFFKVHARLANSMDPMARKILEQAYQALYDAGVSPEQISGQKVGVFIGTCFSEMEKSTVYVSTARTGMALLGCSRTMFANRISYWLNAKGPSMAIDEGCCSSVAALEQAYFAIARGDCEAAVVGAANLCLHPQSTLHHGRVITLSKDGKTKSFDQNADGCVISEAANVLFLQKAKDALRIYAHVVHAKAEYNSVVVTETGPLYGFYRDPKMMADFLRKFYDEAGVPPSVVEYVEAFGSALPECDKAELESFDEVFCKGREEPLLVGSVMSNIGYTEAASGIAALTKVLLGYWRGELAGNLHCDTPRQDVRALREGRLRILTQHARFGRTFTAVNGISVTGVNSHVLLNGHFKPKDLSRYKSDIPRLVTISGRQESAVNKIIEDLKSRPVDPEELALLYNLHKTNITGHMSRGFVVLDTKEDQTTVSLCEKAEYFDDSKRPLWFVYSGMGSQWAGMGAQLMRIPIFAAAIERCHQTLAPKGINIVDIITSTDKSTFDNILHSFVGIAAIQIGLTDILHGIGIVPDKILGHSVGELGCAYADGCLTAEEMILSAYSRGLVSVQTPFIRGSMAAVGLGYQQISTICPPEIEVACHNGPESSTISGPADIMREFVDKLTAQGIFAKEVPCSNIAFHSRYIADGGPALLKRLKEVIRSPKPRSERWVSTSVPQDKWDEPMAKLCSAEYHTNNLLSAVLFEETAALIPSNAVLVEIAPHGLLQAILKRSLPESCCNIALTRRGHPDNAYLVLEAIGKLYLEGYTPNVEVLYPKVEFPVSTGTPMLSHLIEWVHSEEWDLPLFGSDHKRITASCDFVLSIHDEESSYLKGHVIKGKTLYPFAAALVAVWDTLAMSLNRPKKQLSVEFRDVHLYVQPVLHDQRQLRLSVSLHRGNGLFEVLDEDSKVATGFIMYNEDMVEKIIDTELPDADITSEDVYKLLNIKGYSYSGEFCSIHSVNWPITEGLLSWRNNWVTLLDGMLQLNMLRNNYDGVSVVKQIGKLNIDVDEHDKHAFKLDGNIFKKAKIFDHNRTRCGGVTIERLKLCNLPLESDVKFDVQTLDLLPCSDKNLDKQSGGDCYVPLQGNCDNNMKVELQMKDVGVIDSLHWAQAPRSLDTGINVTVHYAGINTLDVTKAFGLIPFENDAASFGIEFSGVTQSGSRVMGVVARGACSSEVRARPELLWPVPAHWTLEDAATVPLAYLNAYYCFLDSKEPTRLLIGNGKLRILIHGGAGAFGQAAISIALSLDYEVFTTVSDLRKKHFLLKLFPTLKEENIGNSRDRSFCDMVLSATRGKGCDIVIILCDVKGELKDETINCCGDFGIVYDMSQNSHQENYLFGMSHLNKERSYVPLDLSSILTKWNPEDIKALHGLVSAGIARGCVRPLSRVTYAPHAAPRAFRLLAASAHRGRVLLHLHVPHLLAQPRFKCDDAHLIVCDSTTLALQLANQLIKRRARKLHLHCVCPPQYLQYKVRSWQLENVQVNVSSEDLSTGVQTLIENAMKLGALAGIHIMATDSVVTSDNKFESLISSFDSVSKKLCPQLRYFTVTCLNNTNTGKDTCFTRVKDGYPATLLQLKLSEPQSDISRMLYASGSACDGVVRVLERAAHSAQPVLVAQQLRAPPAPLLHQIAAVAGIVVPDDCSEKATLESLGLYNEKLQCVCNFLQLHHNIALNEKDVSNMTIARIRQIEDTIFPKQFKETKGLSTFFTHVDPDEMQATTEIMFLRTLTYQSAIDNDFDVTQTYLYIVPGLEGHHKRFSFLCERLKLAALVLQPGLDHPNETIQETAQRYAEVLMKRIGFKKEFYMLGYEWGVPLALEVASILESQGMVGTIFCIGFGPEELKEVLEEELSEYKTEEELQSGVLAHMFRLMSGAESAESAPVQGGAWSSRVEACVRTLLGRVSHSAQYARAQLQAARGRLVQARRYSSTMPPLRSRLVLLRPAHPSPPAPSSAELLSALTCGEVSVHQLSAPLAHAARDARCATIINEYLHPDLIRAFDNSNHCKTYLLKNNSLTTYE